MDLMQVIDQIGREKGIEKGILIEAVGAAILSASRKSLPAAQAALGRLTALYPVTNLTCSAGKLDVTIYED